MTILTWPQAARTAVAYHAAIGDPATARALLAMYEAAGCITAEQARQFAVTAGLRPPELFDLVWLRDDQLPRR